MSGREIKFRSTVVTSAANCCIAFLGYVSTGSLNLRSGKHCPAAWRCWRPCAGLRRASAEHRHVAQRECSGDVHGCSPWVFFKWRKKASLLRNAYGQLSSSRALRPSRTMHSRQQSRLDPSPFIVRTMIGFRHSIAGQPVKQAASCSVRPVIVVFCAPTPAAAAAAPAAWRCSQFVAGEQIGGWFRRCSAIGVYRPSGSYRGGRCRRSRYSRRIFGARSL